jgi:Transposase IS116/IS110/IS902 family
MLADLVRTDRHHHRRVAGDSGLAEAVKVLARGHQQLVWARRRQANMLRSALRAFYPAALAAFGGDPGDRDAVAVLSLAPNPERGRALSQAELVAALRRAGRRRQVDARATAIQAMLASQQLEAPPVLADAYSQVVAAAVAVIAGLSEQLARLEAALTSAFCAHPDAGIVRSQCGLGVVLGARVLAEFGDDPDRYASAKARKAYAGTAPITRASGSRQVVLARAVGNRRLTTACHLWAFAALAGSPGARRYYDGHRARGATHHQALRALGNRLVGILHGCLRRRRPYDEQLAWPTSAADTAA